MVKLIVNSSAEYASDIMIWFGGIKKPRYFCFSYTYARKMFYQIGKDEWDFKTLGDSTTDNDFRLFRETIEKWKRSL